MVGFWEKISGILQHFWTEIKSLKGLQKYEMIYPWDYFWRTKVVLDTIFSYHFVDRDLGFELFFEKNETTK